MIILEKPFISETLLSLLEAEKISVLKNDVSEEYSAKYNLYLIDDEEAREACRRGERVYTISENALSWIFENHPDENLKESIRIIKDKSKFRDVCKKLYPDFYYKKINIKDLRDVDADSLPYPIVLKPAIGFLSIGVYTIENKEDWEKSLAEIYTNFDAKSSAFPVSVIEKTSFIIEEYIKGDEFAVDAYYDTMGEPVVLNIYKHPFVSEKDVSDRLYISSKSIYDKYLESFLTFLREINTVLKFKNFPFHIEFRISDRINPIEMNAMRFAGLCVNELSCHMYGYHSVKSYLDDLHPDYSTLWKGHEDKIYGFIILERMSPEQKLPPATADSPLGSTAAGSSASTTQGTAMTDSPLGTVTAGSPLGFTTADSPQGTDAAGSFARSEELDYEKLQNRLSSDGLKVLEIRKVKNDDLAVHSFVFFETPKTNQAVQSKILQYQIKDFLK